MTDTVLVFDGVVKFRWCNTRAEALPAPEAGSLVEFAPDTAFPGMLWDGSALSLPSRDPEPEPRRLLPKSVVQERVNDIGKLGAVMTILKSAGQELNFARWFASDWPNVYFDDPGMLQLLAAVGCSPAQLAVITAP